MSLLTELHYLGCITYFAELLKHPSVVFEQYEFFEKSTFRNRCYIAGSNGVLMLSIPLVGGRHQHQTISKDVRIDYSYNWQRVHWNSIESAYQSSAFFDYYADSLQPSYLVKPAFLFDFNYTLLQVILKLLRTEITSSFTRSYNKHYESDEIIDFRNCIHPKQLKQTGHFYYPFPAYFQIFAHKYGFLPNLSILDLMFAKGPDTLNYLTS